MAKRDYYDILGVKSTADAETIKTAYRRLAKQHHPDRVEDKDDDSKIREINEAYEVLSDDSKRERYDAELSGAHEVFSHPHWAGGNIPNRGGDIQIPLHLTLEDMFNGGKKLVDYVREVNCETCHHTGLKTGSSSDPCPTCKGAGSVIMSGLNGMFQVKHICGNCRGKGRYIRPENRCETCKGTGRSKRSEFVDVRIPQGVESGDFIDYDGYGHAGTNKGAFGILRIVYIVDDHPTLKRVNQDDLLTELRVSFVEMCLGATADVESPKGSVKIVIPPETPNGRVLRIPDYGIKCEKRQSQGHLLVKLIADTPKDLTAKQIKLLQSFKKEEQHKQREKVSK